MKNMMWNYRHVAVLGLVALLAGCGGGGGGGTTTATCTADCVSGQVTNSSGGGVSDVYVTATNPATGQVCSTSPNKTGSDGSYVLSTTACGDNAVVITAPIGSGTTVVNSWNPGQPSTGVNLNPDTTSSLAAFAGTWTASYSSSLLSGGDSGTCKVVVNQSGVIDATQNVSNCKSNLNGLFTLTGALTDQGKFMGNTSTGATYFGLFVAASKSASGTWKNSANSDNGRWTASLP